MAFRALQRCTPRPYATGLGRALYSTEQRQPTSSLSEVAPMFMDYPVPTLAEYRAGVPAQTGVRSTAARNTKITTLPNGLRVATLTSNDIGRSVGLYVASGTKDEGRATRGVSHLLKYAAYGSTVNRPGYQVIRELEAAGATLNATVGREHMLFSSEFPPNNADTVVPIISDMLHPKLPFHEVVDQKAYVKEDAERMEADPVASVVELLHRQAYRGRGVGQPISANKHDVHHMARGTVFSWVHDHYVPSKAVIVGVGFEHEELVKSVEAAFANKPEHKMPEDIEKEHSEEHGAEQQQQSDASKASRYVGGETLVPASGHTHLAVAFEGASLKGDAKHRIALGVLQHLLGSVLAHNPTSHASLTSRLAKNVLPNSKNYDVLSAFNFSYSDTGLFGVYAETHSDPGRLVSNLVSEMGKLRTALSAEELSKGKAAYKLAILDEGSKRTTALEFIGQQILSSGKAITPEEYATQIDSITAEDIAAAAKKALGSAPTIVVVGDVSSIPLSADLSTSLKGGQQ